MGIFGDIGEKFRSAFSAELISVIAGGVLIYSLSQLLDPNSYGALFLALSIFTVIGLFSRWGVAKSTARFISEYKEIDPKQIKPIMLTGLCLNIFSVTIVSAIFLLIYTHIPEIVGDNNILPFMQVGVLYIIFSTFTYFVRTVLQGFEEIVLSSKFYALERLLRTILAILLVFLGFGAKGALLGYIISSGVIAFSGIFYLYLIKYRAFGWERIENGLLIKISKYTFPLVITHGATVIDKQLDTILVGVFLNPASVAYYVLSRQIVQFVEAPLDALGFTVAPTFKSELTKGRLNHASELYNRSIAYSLSFYIPAATGIVLVSPILIKAIFGEEYAGVVPVLQVLSFYIVIQSVTKLTTNSLDYLGRARERAIIKSATAIMNVCLNIALIPIMGVAGAAIATVLSHAIYAIANVYIINLELNVDMLELSSVLGKVLFVSILMGIVIYPLAIGLPDVFSTLFSIILGVCIWAILSHKFKLINFKEINNQI